MHVHAWLRSLVGPAPIAPTIATVTEAVRAGCAARHTAAPLRPRGDRHRRGGRNGSPRAVGRCGRGAVRGGRPCGLPLGSGSPALRVGQAALGRRPERPAGRGTTPGAAPAGAPGVFLTPPSGAFPSPPPPS